MKYTVNAKNAQGAFYNVGNFSSLDKAITAARNELGAGWKVKITKFETDIVVKEWTTRK